MPRSGYLSSLLLSCLLLPCSPVLAQTSPAQTVDSFLILRLADHSSGAPSGATLLSYSPYFAPELVCLLGAAQRYSEQHAKALPGDKPPFVEGDLYSSSFEVPTHFQAEAPRVQGDTATVRVRFEVATANGGEAGARTSWQDEMRLRHINGRRWQIEDVVYQGEFPFGNHGSLRANLLAVLSNPQAGSGWDARELTSCEIPATKKGAAKKGATKKSNASAKKSSSSTAKKNSKQK